MKGAKIMLVFPNYAKNYASTIDKGLDWTGLDWTGLDWTSKTRTSKTRSSKSWTSKTRLVKRGLLKRGLANCGLGNRGLVTKSSSELTFLSTPKGLTSKTRILHHYGVRVLTES